MVGRCHILLILITTNYNLSAISKSNAKCKSVTKTLQLSIIAIASIAVIGIIIFAVILPLQPIPKIEGLDQDTGFVTIGIQSYYFTTVNDTMTTVRGEGVQELFHDVVFTFFPSPAYMGPIGSCGGITFGSDAKFSDGIHELLQVPLLGQPCGKDYFKTDLSNHTNPQAGLTIYNDKIKLLVSKIPQTLSKQLATACTAGPEMSCDNQPATMSQNNGTLSGDVVLAGGPSNLVGPKANYEVDVYATDGVTIVGKTLSDANAHYSIQLPAGNYIIYAPDYPTKQTHLVSVFSDKNTILNIVYGTGYK